MLLALSRREAGREVSLDEKGGDGVEKTKVGKGSEVMAVVDGNGLPLGLRVDSAQPHKVTLAETTLKTIRVPQKRVRPKTRPEEAGGGQGFGQRGIAARYDRHLHSYKAFVCSPLFSIASTLF